MGHDPQGFLGQARVMPGLLDALGGRGWVKHSTFPVEIIEPIVKELLDFDLVATIPRAAGGKSTKSGSNHLTFVYLNGRLFYQYDRFS
jgi:hypothetical protein